MEAYRNKVALITGGGSGIGAGLAEVLAAEQATVVVADIHLPSAEAVADKIKAAGGKAIALHLDVTKPDAWKACVAHVEKDVGPIDVLCSNAGVVGALKPILELPADYMRWVMDVNLMGAFHGVQAVVPQMKARGRGQVMFTASIGGLNVAKWLADYCASKHALIALADSLREELADTGVSVSVVCPAAVETGLSETTRRQLAPQFDQAVGHDSDAAQQAVAEAKRKVGGAMSALEAARLSIEGMRRRQFFVFTHLAASDRATARFAEIKQSLEALQALS